MRLSISTTALVQDKRASTREYAIVSLLTNRDTIGRKDVETALRVSQPTAVLVLRDLVNRGVLEKEGGGKYTRYRLKR